ncbi:MAG: pilus (MSHA type) biogenesis protein MshL [Nitrospirae bacterium]|nr:pilus (MSHA type) biogenesis protein MshL [Nitrospirota bacterium]
MNKFCGRVPRSVLMGLLILSLTASCASDKFARKAQALESFSTKAGIPPEEVKVEEKAEITPRIESAPVNEEISSLKTKTISISARNTPLRDVLYTIAESAFLNLVIERGVDPETPVTITLKDMNIQDVLDTVLASVDYFYTVRNNILTIKFMDTRILEFGQPSVIQDYSIIVGGDMLGNTKTGSAGVSGNITQKIETDKDSFKFWDSVERGIAGILNIQTNQQQSKSGSSGFSAGFSINRMTGTIVVTASRKDISRVENYINTLKKTLRRQVLVEARIVEVQLTDSIQYGVDWSFLGRGWDNVGNLAAGTTGFTSPLNSLPNFNLSLTGGDFTSLLKALQQQGNINVLSNPRMNIMNGQTAFLSVGRKVDFISKVETTSTGTSTSVPTVTYSVETSSVLSGIVFGIVPYISASDDNNITLTISPIITDLVKLNNKTIGAAGNAVELSLPTVDLRELSTTVQVKDGQMVIIGGLIQNKDRLADNNVPYLANIPVIGYLFKNRDRSYEKTELIIMLKPLIVSDPI